MAYRHDGGLSPGDIGDPVADSIRAEQNQAAMPGPEEANRALECDNCDTQDETVARRPLIAADCTALQQPDVPWTQLCEDCADARPSLREEHRKKAQKHVDADYHADPVAIAFYECGRANYVTEPDENDTPNPHQMETPPTAPVQCLCGEPLADVELSNADGQFIGPS